jgi:hypothetical protein
LGADVSPDLEDAPDEALFCARHPRVETYLRCGNCGTPICPRCLVQTPVGARCPTCAHVSKLPTFNVTPVFFARAMTAALISGIVVGLIWAFIASEIRFGIFFMIFAGIILGTVIAEAVSASTNRKRGLGLQICAALGVVLAYLIFFTFQETAPFQGRQIDGTDLIVTGIGIAVAVSRLKGF